MEKKKKVIKQKPITLDQAQVLGEIRKKKEQYATLHKDLSKKLSLQSEELVAEIKRAEEAMSNLVLQERTLRHELVLKHIDALLDLSSEHHTSCSEEHFDGSCTRCKLLRVKENPWETVDIQIEVFTDFS